MLSRCQDYEAQRSILVGTNHTSHKQCPPTCLCSPASRMVTVPWGGGSQDVLGMVELVSCCFPEQWGLGRQVSVRQELCLHPKWGLWGGNATLSDSCLASKCCQPPAPCRAGLLPGSRCRSGKGTIIHQRDKAADERRASEQLFLSSGWNGCWRSRGGGRGESPFCDKK